MKSTSLMVVAAMAALVSIAGCQKEEGPLEKAGKKLDNAAGEIGDTAEETAKKVEKAVKGE